MRGTVSDDLCIDGSDSIGIDWMGISKSTKDSPMILIALAVVAFVCLREVWAITLEAL